MKMAKQYFQWEIQTILPVLDHLNLLQTAEKEQLQKYKTKVYLTKDSFMSKKYFKNAYKDLNKFKEIKEKYDPLKLINSFQSQRLGF